MKQKVRDRSIEISVLSSTICVNYEMMAELVSDMKLQLTEVAVDRSRS
jgi:hypothetical protein